MKKEKNNNTTELFESFLPDRVKDDPNENLKKEKKLYTIIFIVVCTLMLVANLISMIIAFCLSLASGFSALFVGFINVAVDIFLIGLLIVVAHNISKMTRATLFMCSKMMRDEKRYAKQVKMEAKEANENNEENDIDGENVNEDESSSESNNQVDYNNQI